MVLKNEFKITFNLTIIIAVLAAIASAGGFFIKGLYRDNLLVTSGWYGNDLVTLFVAVPLLAGAMFYAGRGLHAGFMCGNGIGSSFRRVG